MLAFIRHNFRWLAGGFALTYFSSFGQTYFISASVAEWRSAFSLSHGEFGRLYMFATLGSAACLPFVGKLVDRFAEHRLIMLVVPMLAGASLLAAFAPTVTLLVLAIFLLRLLGQGMMTHIALTATGRWFSAQRGRAVSLVVLGHQGGEATLPLAFSALALAYGYRAGWLAGAVALVLVGLPLAAWAYRKPRLPQQSVGAKALNVKSWTRLQVLRDPPFWLLLTGVLAPPFIGTTIFYHQDYMTVLRDWPPQLFAVSLSVLALTTVVFALITGALVDRLGARAVLPFFLLPLAAACASLGIEGPPAMLFFTMVLLGISYGISSTLFGALWPEIYGPLHLGSIRSIVVSAAVLATALGPGVTGTLIDYGVALPTQMTVLAVYCLAGSAVMAAVSVQLRQRLAVAQ